MKRKLLIFILAICVPVMAHAYISPGKPQGFVSDFAGVLSSADKASLESKLSNVEKTTGDEIAVVTVTSLGGDTVENYAEKLFQEWGIGDKDKDNGLLILVAVEDHDVRLEVGYGLEGTVTDLQSGNIIRKVMIPAFKNADYAGGISGAVDALSLIIIGSPAAEQFSEPAPTSSSGGSINWNVAFFLVVIVIHGLARLLGKSKSWWLGGLIGAVIGGIIGLIWGFFFLGIIGIAILTPLGLLFDYLASKNGNGGKPGGIGGWWIFGGPGGKGGSGGGGFGGFGGGSSGGGGASGHW